MNAPTPRRSSTRASASPRRRAADPFGCTCFVKPARRRLVDRVTKAHDDGEPGTASHSRSSMTRRCSSSWSTHRGRGWELLGDLHADRVACREIVVARTTWFDLRGGSTMGGEIDLAFPPGSPTSRAGVQELAGAVVSSRPTARGCAPSRLLRPHDDGESWSRLDTVPAHARPASTHAVRSLGVPYGELLQRLRVSPSTVRPGARLGSGRAGTSFTCASSWCRDRSFEAATDAHAATDRDVVVAVTTLAPRRHPGRSPRVADLDLGREPRRARSWRRRLVASRPPDVAPARHRASRAARSWWPLHQPEGRHLAVGHPRRQGIVLRRGRRSLRSVAVVGAESRRASASRRRRPPPTHRKQVGDDSAGRDQPRQRTRRPRR